MAFLYNFIRWVMKYILRISEIIFGSGLLVFFFKWVVDGIKSLVIKRKLFKNVVYEIFLNTLAMGFTCETNMGLLNFPSNTDIVIYKYSFTAWRTLLQSGFIKNIKFKDMLFLEQLYFQIEKLDESIKEYYGLPYNERMARQRTFRAVTNRLIELHNGFVTSEHFKVWNKKYGDSYVKDSLELMVEFKGKKFPPEPLPKTEKNPIKNSIGKENDRTYSR